MSTTDPQIKDYSNEARLRKDRRVGGSMGRVMRRQGSRMAGLRASRGLGCRDLVFRVWGSGKRHNFQD